MNKVAVVVISYNPKSTLKERLEGIDCIDVFLYNNSRETYRYKNERVFEYGVGLNNGLAAPLNELMGILKAKNYSHFCFFDQDTVFTNETIKYMLEEIGGCDYSIVNFKGGDKKSYSQPRFIINSGTIFNINDIIKINGFNEEYFVDLVDYEICARARFAGLKILKIQGAPGFDHISEQSETAYSVFGKRFTLLKEYGEKRRSNIYKNSRNLLIYLFRKNKLVDVFLVVKFLLIFAIFQIVIDLKK